MNANAATFGNCATSWTTTVIPCCGAHSWKCESLRGTNRNQRVEHVRCLNCGKRQTRVWLDLPKGPKPNRVYDGEPA